MPSLAARAKQVATHKLDQEPFGLRHAECVKGHPERSTLGAAMVIHL